MNSNKILFGILIALMLCIPIALAQENTEDVIEILGETAEPVLISEPEEIKAEEEEVELEEIEGLAEPGITPDSPLYGLKRAMERIQLALTFNKAEKAKLGLVHANGRLAEVQAMVQEKKIEHAQKAQKLHDQKLEYVEKIVNELSEKDAEDEAESVVEIEQKINSHRMVVEKVNNALVKTKGNLTEAQQNMVQEMVQSMEGTTAKLRIEVQNKREETKIKVKIQTGQTDEEVEGIMNQFAEQHQLNYQGESRTIMPEIQNKQTVKPGDINTDNEETDTGSESNVAGAAKENGKSNKP